MNSRTNVGKVFIVAWLGSFLIMFVLSGLFNTLLVREFVESNIGSELLRNPPSMTLIALGYIVLSFIMALIYPQFEQLKIFSAFRAFSYGVVFGIVWLLPYSLVLHGVYNFPLVALVMDSGWALIEQGAGGLVIGFAYNQSY